MEKANLPGGVHEAVVDHIPLLWAEPLQPQASRPMVIWLSGLMGKKEWVVSELRDLAAAGFVGLSFDAWQHGSRMVEGREEFKVRVTGNLRRHMWPIVGQTAEEVPRVIDWAVENLKVSPRVRMGGCSMGGDIAVVAAGLDRRIEVVAAALSSPDWLRPGTESQTGTPDTYAQNFYNRRNPLTHVELYSHRPAITFQNGELDKAVPPDGAVRFRTALAPYYQNCPHKLDVTLHAGVGHELAPAMWQNCMRWFSAPF